MKVGKVRKSFTYTLEFTEEELNSIVAALGRCSFNDIKKSLDYHNVTGLDSNGVSEFYDQLKLTAEWK